MLDYGQLNTRRLDNFQQFDFRLDKSLNFLRLALDPFLGMQNAFVLKNPGLPNHIFERLADNSGFATTNGQPSNPMARTPSRPFSKIVPPS